MAPVTASGGHRPPQREEDTDGEGRPQGKA